MVVSFARREYLLRSNYSTWHLCGGGQNEATSLKKACKNRSKRKKERKGSLWQLEAVRSYGWRCGGHSGVVCHVWESATQHSGSCNNAIESSS